MYKIEDILNRFITARAEDYLSELPPESVDFWIASPPYDKQRDYSHGAIFDFDIIACQSYRVLKPGGVGVWVVGDSVINGSESLTSFKHAIGFVERAGYRLHDTMIYKKTSSPYPDKSRYYQVFEYMFVLSKGAPKTVNLQIQKSRWGGELNFAPKTQRKKNGELESRGEKKRIKPTRVMDNVWTFAVGFEGSSRDKIVRKHPAIFPEYLAERHILTWTNPGDIVLDFFSGSGTSAKMARLHNRNFLACDISPEYNAIAEERLAPPFTPTLF